MDASTVEPAQDDFDRRVKPRVDDTAFGEASFTSSHDWQSALLLPETPITRNMHSPLKLDAASPPSLVVESGSVKELYTPSQPLHAHTFLHEPPASAPGDDGDAPSDCSSFSHVGAGVIPSSLTSFTTGSICSVPVGGQRPSPNHSQSLLSPYSSQNGCSGGTGQCSTPHLRILARGMCSCCYQREYRQKTLGNTPLKAKGSPLMKAAPVKREHEGPPVERAILLDEYGVPILDKFGIPIKVSPFSCPTIHTTPLYHPPNPDPPFLTPPDPHRPPQTQTSHGPSLLRSAR